MQQRRVLVQIEGPRSHQPNISHTHTISPLSHLPRHPILTTPRAVRGWHRPMSTRRHCSPHWHKNWVYATKNSTLESCLLGCMDWASVRSRPTLASSHAQHTDSGCGSSRTTRAYGCRCTGSAYDQCYPSPVFARQRQRHLHLHLHLPDCTGWGSARHHRNQERAVDPSSWLSLMALTSHQGWKRSVRNATSRMHDIRAYFLRLSFSLSIVMTWLPVRSSSRV